MNLQEAQAYLYEQGLTGLRSALATALVYGVTKDDVLRLLDRVEADLRED